MATARHHVMALHWLPLRLGVRMADGVSPSPSLGRVQLLQAPHVPHTMIRLGEQGLPTCDRSWRGHVLPGGSVVGEEVMSRRWSRQLQSRGARKAVCGCDCFVMGFGGGSYLTGYIDLDHPALITCNSCGAGSIG